ncbi:MAG: YqgE/AlgH family protein [bacterium]
MEEQTLAPTLLLAMPQMTDPNFHRAVVLLCRHGDEGALGFVVNRPIDVDLADLLEFDEPIDDNMDLTAWQGGPVKVERGWLVWRGEPSDDDILQVCDGIYMSSSQAHLHSLIVGDPSVCRADRSRLLLGYAGWGPGQLDEELLASAWLNIPVDPELVFETPADEVWERAIRTLGVEPNSIAPGPGIH